jgi:hypothetical protein
MHQPLRRYLFAAYLLFVLFLTQTSFGRTEFADTATGEQQTSRPAPSEIQNYVDNDIKLANCLVKNGSDCLEKCTLSRTECENHANGLKKLSKEELDAIAKKANQKLALSDLEIKLWGCMAKCNLCPLGARTFCKSMCVVRPSTTPVCGG